MTDDRYRPTPAVAADSRADSDADDAAGQLPGTVEPRFTGVEQALEAALLTAHLARAADLPRLVRQQAAALSAHDATIYLVDVQQSTLVPFIDQTAPGNATDVSAGEPHFANVTLPVEGTLAGRAFQHNQIVTGETGPPTSAAVGDNPRPSGHPTDPHAAGAVDPFGTVSAPTGLRVWMPLLDGTERIGVLAVTAPAGEAVDPDSTWLRRLRWFTSLVAELVMTKTMYGDTIVRLRRSQPMTLAAEIQWSLLPPLTFGSDDVIITAGLEPAYRVAGDSVDYAVDAGIARMAVFDGMGHGLASAQLVNLVVNAYRHARRTQASLADTASAIDAAVTDMFAGETFSTGLLAELDTDAGEFRWVSAGHLEPLLLRDGRLVRALHTTPLLPFGLGADLPGAPATAEVGVEHLQPGDLLLLYTDGITEARSAAGEFFGVDRLVDLVTRNLAAGLPAPETLRRVIRALLDHQGGALDDDASVLLAQWRADGAAQLLPQAARHAPASDT